MHALIIGGTRFVGALLTFRLLARGDTVTLFNRGRTPDPFGDRVERLRGDRTTPDLARSLAGRRFDAVIDFAAFTGDDARGAIEALGDRAGHYVCISTGHVYLVRESCPRPARTERMPAGARRARLAQARPRARRRRSARALLNVEPSRPGAGLVVFFVMNRTLIGK